MLYNINNTRDYTDYLKNKYMQIKNERKYLKTAENNNNIFIINRVLQKEISYLS